MVEVIYIIRISVLSGNNGGGLNSLRALELRDEHADRGMKAILTT